MAQNRKPFCIHKKLRIVCEKCNPKEEKPTQKPQKKTESVKKQHTPIRREYGHFGDDPVAYYQEHYAGLTRGQLNKENPGLYKRLWKDGLLEHVPIKQRDFGEPVVYYNEHYADLTRGQLEKEDPSLYQRLRRDGLLKHIPKKRKEKT